MSHYGQKHIGAISVAAFCAFRGKSRGRDAPPTMDQVGAGMPLLQMDQVGAGIAPPTMDQVGAGMPLLQWTKSGQGCPSYKRTKSGQGCPSYNGPSRGRDAPPTTTLQILMSDLLSELV